MYGMMIRVLFCVQREICIIAKKMELTIPDIKRHIDKAGPVVTREVKPVANDATMRALPMGLLEPYVSDNDPPKSRANILPKYYTNSMYT